MHAPPERPRPHNNQQVRKASEEQGISTYLDVLQQKQVRVVVLRQEFKIQPNTLFSTEDLLERVQCCRFALLFLLLRLGQRVNNLAQEFLSRRIRQIETYLVSLEQLVVVFCAFRDQLA